jgi:hypothetical protein
VKKFDKQAFFCYTLFYGRFYDENRSHTPQTVMFAILRFAGFWKSIAPVAANIWAVSGVQRLAGLSLPMTD